MLVGPNAPLVVERGLRSTHMQHVYDFYKPDMSSEYPRVDGKLSIQCYLGALDKCYLRYIAKAEAALQKVGEAGRITVDSFDGLCFHSPYCKLVQKSLARLVLNDFLRDPSPDTTEGSRYASVESFRNVKLEDTFFDKNVEKAFMGASKEVFQEKTQPSLRLANQVGNMYTPSLYGGLVSYLASVPLDQLPNKRIALFSYGSGMASSLYSIRVAQDASPGSPLAKLRNSLNNLEARLGSRRCVEPGVFADTMKLREDTHHLAKYTPQGSIEDLFPGTWYLTYVDEMHRRQYNRSPISQQAVESPQIIKDSVKESKAEEAMETSSVEQVTAS